jgi:hypothetical protein
VKIAEEEDGDDEIAEAISTQGGALLLHGDST